MFTVSKILHISAAHQLNLPYDSDCNNPHGHNYEITVYCRSETLNQHGMVVDFSEIKSKIKDFLDHKDLNKIFDFPTTAENLAKWCCEQIPEAFKVSVRETQGNEATYEL